MIITMTIPLVVCNSVNEQSSQNKLNSLNFFQKHLQHNYFYLHNGWRRLWI